MTRSGLFKRFKQELPGWPDYVITDMIYTKIDNVSDFNGKMELIQELRDQIKSWNLHQNVKLTFDMLDGDTQRMMKERKFGSLQHKDIPNDLERSEAAEKVIKTKQLQNMPPVIMVKRMDGYDLWEGWHRTMAAFRLSPDGIIVNAWIGSTNNSQHHN